MKPLQTAIPQGEARKIKVGDLKAAEARGRKAYAEGRSRYSCTYADVAMAEAWERGFEAVLKEWQAKSDSWRAKES